MKTLLLILAILVSVPTYAQNTSREPVGGGTTNPVTQSEAPDPNLVPQNEPGAKKRSKGKVTLPPPEQPSNTSKVE